MLKSVFKIIVIITVIGAFSSCDSKSYKIKGNLVEPDTLFYKVVYLEKYDRPDYFMFDTFITVDSAEISENGEFVFKLPKGEEDIYRLRFLTNQTIMFVSGNTNTIIKDIKFGGKKRFTLKGSKSTKICNQIEELNDLVNEEAAPLQKAYSQLSQDYLEAEKVNDSTLMNQISVQMDEYQAENSKINGRYAIKFKKLIEENMPSVASIYALGYLDVNSDYRYLKDFAKRVEKEMPESTPAKHFVEYMSRVNSEGSANKTSQSSVQVIGTKVGMYAPDFSLQQPNGKMLSLSSLKGKYVLLDFWASWCKPCRLENPHLKKIYNEFNKNNLEILGVSLDDNEKAWIEAVQKDGLTWPQVLDLDQQTGEKKVAEKYEIMGIPTNYLLNPEGRIVAANLRGSTLEKVLAEVVQ